MLYFPKFAYFINNWIQSSQKLALAIYFRNFLFWFWGILTDSQFTSFILLAFTLKCTNWNSGNLSKLFNKIRIRRGSDCDMNHLALLLCSSISLVETRFYLLALATWVEDMANRTTSIKIQLRIFNEFLLFFLRCDVWRDQLATDSSTYRVCYFCFAILSRLVHRLLSF